MHITSFIYMVIGWKSDQHRVIELLAFAILLKSDWFMLHDNPLLDSFMLKAMTWGIVVEQMLTEVVDRGRKLHCGPWTKVVSHATPPHLVKVKINFDEAQKLTWKEITCFYGLKTIITWNHISELLKMQLESKSRNVHTYSRGPVAGSFQNTLWPCRRASASEAAILASGAFAFVFSLYKVLIALSLCLSSRALQHAVSTSIIAAKIV